MTIRDPSKIPITTHSRRPKMDVGFESSVLRKAASYMDILTLLFLLLSLAFLAGVRHELPGELSQTNSGLNLCLLSSVESIARRVEHKPTKKKKKRR